MVIDIYVCFALVIAYVIHFKTPYGLSFRSTLLNYIQHFVGGNGPTVEFPDPLQADGSAVRPTRPLRKRTSTFTESNPVSKKKKTSTVKTHKLTILSSWEVMTSNRLIPSLHRSQHIHHKVCTNYHTVK